MDPSGLLKEMRALCVKRRNHVLDDDDINALVESFERLDVWVMHGGFLPKDWAESLKGRETI